MPLPRLRWARALRATMLAFAAVLVAILPVGPWLISERPLIGQRNPGAWHPRSERLPHAASWRLWPTADLLIIHHATPFNCQDWPTRLHVVAAASPMSLHGYAACPTTFDEAGRGAVWRPREAAPLVVTFPYHTAGVGDGAAACGRQVGV